VDRVVQECLRPFLELSGPPLEYLPNGPLPLVEGDRAQLLQVLSGLVLNAREAQGPVTTPIRLRSWQTEPGGEEGGLWIHPPPQGTSVCLEVEDHGSGMTKEVLEKAFDPFFTTHRPGRGLGLSAALGILKAHHAGLWVSSAPGRGATFRIFLPPSPQALDPQAPRAALLPMTQVGILLVDDDEDLQATLGEFLRGILGYPVFQALDGLEAVEIYRQAREEVGIILMDATMPRMNGPDAFRIIRELNPDAQAILLSGYTEEAGNQVARESGFRSFLKKPFSLEDLGNAVKGALAR
jgi:CheY-like chemotaxis protein